MAGTETEFSYIGVGELLLAPYAFPNKMFKVGNVNKLDFSFSESEKSIKNFKTTGGAKANSLRTLDSVSLSVGFVDRTADNLAVIFRGDTASVATAAIVDEVKTAYLGRYIKLDKQVGVTGHVVKHTSGTPTYTLNTDYTVDSKGLIKIPLTGGAITDGQSLKISYNHKAFEKVEPLINASVEYKALFMGLNGAQSGKEFVIEIHKIKFGVPSSLPIIGEDFAAMEAAADALADTTITTAGLSQFMTIRQVEA